MNGQGVSGGATAQESTVVGPPSIISFKAKSRDIAEGTNTLLSWETYNASTVSISGVGQVALSGSTEVKPERSRTYVLTAYNDQGQTALQSLDLRVNKPMMGKSGKRYPKRSDVTNSLPPNQFRPKEVTKLEEKAPSGRMAAIGSSATGASTVELPKIISFTASSGLNREGNTSILTWKTDNATSVSITDLGQVALSGSADIRSGKTKIYVLTASNAQGQSTSKKISVNVAQPSTTQLRKRNQPSKPSETMRYRPTTQY
jgi:hypothetical protein